MYFTTMPTPLGEMTLTTDGEFLTGLSFDGKRPDGAIEDSQRLAPFACELREYLAGERKAFSFQVRQPGTSFQQIVWKELMTIPYGTTIGYGTLARRIGSPHASRAVGSANGRNRIAIVIPCHRVIAGDGSIGGYGGTSGGKNGCYRSKGVSLPR